MSKAKSPPSRQPRRTAQPPKPVEAESIPKPAESIDEALEFAMHGPKKGAAK